MSSPLKDQASRPAVSSPRTEIRASPADSLRACAASNNHAMSCVERLDFRVCADFRKSTASPCRLSPMDADTT
ncbi:hypothetical protein QW131_04920 [Roseibium salinum]|nr:hypothetical protein [Roseibium salinum]